MKLTAAGVESARTDAEVLLAFVLDVVRSEVARLVVIGRSIPGDTAARYRELVDRRATREPLQHLTGVAGFRHLEIVVGPGVFVPRPETEVVAGHAIELARAAIDARGSATVVDLCAGSGAIALSVADEVPGAQVYAVELDAQAYAWAEQNTRSIDNGVVLIRGDARTAFHDLNGQVDVVVTNPPYVPSDAVPRDPEVAHHDPGVALYGLGPDGFEVPRGILMAARRLLKPGGVVVMEHAEVQAELARHTAQSVGLTHPWTLDDLTGRPRAVVAQQPDVTD